MKKLFTLLVMTLAFNANAALINLSLDSNTINAGDQVTINLTATEWVDVSAFSFDLLFDTDQFAIPESGGDLLMDDSDLFASLVFMGITYPGGINFSFLDFLPLNGDFLIASFQLTALTSGTFGFDLDFGVFADLDDNPLDVSLGQSAALQVNAVPEPAAWGLMMLALAGIFAARRSQVH